MKLVEYLSCYTKYKRELTIDHDYTDSIVKDLKNCAVYPEVIPTLTVDDLVLLMDDDHMTVPDREIEFKRIGIGVENKTFKASLYSMVSDWINDDLDEIPLDIIDEDCMDTEIYVERN